jgi:hypothetical protein
MLLIPKENISNKTAGFGQKRKSHPVPPCYRPITGWRAAIGNRAPRRDHKGGHDAPAIVRGTLRHVVAGLDHRPLGKMMGGKVTLLTFPTPPRRFNSI